MTDDRADTPNPMMGTDPTRRRVAAGLAGAALAALGIAGAGGETAARQESTQMSDEHEQELDRAIARTREVTADFPNGDPGPWKANCSHAPDATLFGGWGGHEQGWEQLGPRYDWAAARWESGEVEFEALARHVSGDLAATVHFERSRAKLAGVAGEVPVALRVTHLFRREAGEWRLLHRHADALVAIQTTDSVVDK